MDFMGGLKVAWLIGFIIVFLIICLLAPMGDDPNDKTDNNFD